MPTPSSLALVGCGKMGGALLQGWIARNTASHYYVLDPAGLPEAFDSHTPGLITFFDNPALFAAARPAAPVWVMAVKPQIMDEVCETIRKAVAPETLILSIAAGQSIAGFQRRFGAAQPVIRAMPNLPAAIGAGITVVCPAARVSAAQKTRAQELLTAVGAVEWIADENLLDAVTALSGSGPAYVFLLIETLTAAGRDLGLAPDLAAKLARQTVIGSALLAQADNAEAATLRQNVTSPGGTTEAALKVLMAEKGLSWLLAEALEAAARRSRELRAD